MAEKIISPGVFTNEIDQSFLPAAVADIGAALVGPTLKGPAGIPTIVTSFSDFQAKFGDVIKFFTKIATESRPQDNSQATYAHKIDKAEAKIDCQDDAQLINQKIHFES